MARKEETRGFKLAKELADACEDIAKELGLGVSTNSFIERAMSEVVALIKEPPERRRVPKLIVQIDDARTAEERRPPFPITPQPGENHGDTKGIARKPAADIRARIRNGTKENQ
jgi:hypothetical protein